MLLLSARLLTRDCELYSCCCWPTSASISLLVVNLIGAGTAAVPFAVLLVLVWLLPLVLNEAADGVAPLDNTDRTGLISAAAEAA